MCNPYTVTNPHTPSGLMTKPWGLAVLIVVALLVYAVWSGVTARGILIAVSTALIIGVGVFLLARRD
jgi:hypothetical protein